MKYIFVSSTFRDMQAERDAVQNIVMPRLRKDAQKYGDDVYLCDLRWGINTSQMESHKADEKILFSCMNEIDRCRPFMIVMLGERYGTSFDVEFIQRVAESKKNYLLLPRSCNQESVTELEIEYGSLSTPEALHNTVFMFREPIVGAPEDYGPNGTTDEERAENAAMLAELKQKIVVAAEKMGTRVITYSLGWDAENERVTGIESFIELLSNAVTEMLKPEWDQISRLPEHKIERIRHGRVVSNYANQFVGRRDLLSDCVKKLEGGRVAIKITGPAGSGRSVLFSKLFVEMKEHGWNVYPFMRESDSSDDSYLAMLRQWIRYIEDELNIEHEEVEEINDEYERYNPYMERLEQLLKQYDSSELPPLLLGMDSPYISEYWRYEDFEKLRTKRINFVFSYRKDEDENYPHYKPAKNHIFLGNYPLSGRVLLESAVMRSGKELHPVVIEKILERYGSATPLYLSLLVHRLLIMDEKDFRFVGTDKEFDPSVSAQLRLLDSISPELPQMIRLIVQVAGDRFGREQTDATVRLLCYTDGGLRRADIRNIVESTVGIWDEESFSRLICLLPSIFIEHQDGTIAIKTKDIRQTLTAGDEYDLTIINHAIEHVSGLEMGDFIRHEALFDLYTKKYDYAISQHNTVAAREVMISALEAIEAEFLTHWIFKYYDSFKMVNSLFSKFEHIWRLEGRVDTVDLEFCYNKFLFFNRDQDSMLSYYHTFAGLVEKAIRVLVELGASAEVIKPYLEVVTTNGVFAHYKAYTACRENLMLCHLYENGDSKEDLILLQGAIKAAEQSIRRLDAFERRTMDFWWHRSALNSIEARNYANFSEASRSKRAYRMALKYIKVRARYNFSQKKMCWSIMGDTLSPLLELLGWGGHVYADNVLSKDDDSIPDLQEYIIEDLRTARVHERKSEMAVSAIFYKSALERAERVVAMQGDGYVDEYSRWMYAVCLQSYARICHILAGDYYYDDKKIALRIVAHYTKALDLLKELGKVGKNVVVDVAMAIAYYSLGTLPDSSIDRKELLDRAEKLTNELILKTGAMFLRLLRKSIRREKRKLSK